MQLAPGFSTQETSELTGMPFSKMNYLDRSGLIVPIRLGKGKKAPLSYDWRQVIQLTVYENVNRRLSSKILKEILDEINNNYHLPEFLQLNYFVYNDTLQWYHNNVPLPEIMKVIESNYKNNTNPQYLFPTILTMPPNYSPNLSSDEENLKDKPTEEDMPPKASLIWHPSFSMKDTVEKIVKRARESNIVNFEEFKQLSNYDSFKDVLDLE